MPSRQIRVTEREVADWVCAEINIILSQGGYPFKEATAEPSIAGEKRRFPDVVIWFDRQVGNAFSFIELKPPGKIEDRGRLPKVAEKLPVQYILTWNFCLGELMLYEKGGLITKKSYPTYTLSNLEDWLRDDKKAVLRANLKAFLADFRELHERGKVFSFEPDKTFFVSVLQDANEKLYKHFAAYLPKVLQRKGKRERILAYLAEQGIPDLPLREVYELLGRQWAHGLLARVIFYMTLRRHFPELREISKLKKGELPSEIIPIAFKSAKDIDWQAAFENDDPIEEIGIPESCNPDLKILLAHLDEYDFGKLKEDVIGEIYENLIPESERGRLGQYFTREDLVDLILGFVVSDVDGHYCDPTCGSGTFLNRIYSRIKFLSGRKKKHQDLLPLIWGVDIAKFPASLATIGLFRQEPGNFDNFPRVVKEDFFKVRASQEFEFPPLQAPKGDFKKIKEKIPVFWGMAGNFPFVRQEQIEKKSKGYKRELVRSLAYDWLREYAYLFKDSIISSSEFTEVKQYGEKELEAYVDRLLLDKKFDLKLSGQADIYAYLFMHAAKFLKPGARMGFISSNSYLDVSYGRILKTFFLDHFKIIAVVGSWVEPWFHFASVNTIFTILEKCDNAQERAVNKIKFVKLKKKLEDLIPFRDLVLQEPERWNHIDRLVSKIEFESGWTRKQRRKISHQIECVENDDYIIRTIAQEYIEKELQERGELAKWGKYIRAPDIYFDILDRCKQRLIPLRKICDIRRGYTTGINRFFYLKPTGKKAKRKGCRNVVNSLGWVCDIEREFLKPVIKSPKQTRGILVDDKKLTDLVFLCSLEKSNLKKSSKTGALKYIEWGENQQTEEGIPWPLAPTVRDRKPGWYSLPGATPVNLLWTKSYDDTFLQRYCRKAVIADQRLYEIDILEKKDTNLIAGILNSTLFSLFIELGGRVNLGDGALDTTVEESKNHILIPDPKLIRNTYKKKIQSAFDRLAIREIKPIREELKKSDRRELDKIILESLGIYSEENIKAIYEAIKMLVNERLSLAKMRKKVAKAKIDISYQQIKEHVEKEIVPDGLESFPDAFIGRIARSDLLEIPTTGRPLHVGKEFFGKYDIMDKDGAKIYEAEGLDTADYIICCYRENELIIRVPKSDRHVTKAVKSYEKYIRDLHQKLLSRAMSVTHDHKAAERVALEILRENGYSGFFDLS